MKPGLIKTVSAAVAVSAVIGISAIAASNYGTREDPLVTLSYVNDKLTPDLLTKVRSDVDFSALELQKKIDDAITQSATNSVETFSVVKMKNGQKLSAKTGTEIILREGNAVCSSSSDGLINVSSGLNVESAKNIELNNLMMAVNESDGVTARSDLTLLVRGTYTIS